MTTTTYEPQLTEGEVTERRTELLLDGRLFAYRLARHRKMTATGGTTWGEETVREVCTRCGGSGRYSFNLMDLDKCYGCNGSGLGRETTEADILRRARNRAKAAERRARKEREAAERDAAEAESWRAEHADLWSWLSDFLPSGIYGEEEFFLTELAGRALFRPLTEKQVAAAREAYDRWSAKRARERQQKAVGHFGEVGKRVEVDVEVVATKFFASERWDRQSQHLVIMRTAEGHTLKTWTSGAFGYEVEAGQRVRIRGTVKSHGEYEGLPETLLTRVTAVG